LDADAAATAPQMWRTQRLILKVVALRARFVI